MSPSEDPHAEKVVVCGLCEQLLEGTYDGEAAAQEAADAHERDEHPDREHVVVIPVGKALVEIEGEEGVVDIAKGAQTRLERGRDGEGPLG